MLLSLAWLREFTPYDGSAEKLGDKLTMLGLELEEIIHPFENIRPILTGYVAECVAHPDSDHLHCCKVDVGQEALLDIVCGAPNVAAGQKVPVATVGTRLPDGTLIKKARLRGQPSFGMICSERELGLSDDHGGIMVLPDAVKVGISLVDALDMDRDVLDISVTPNRPDCLSVLGLARETALAFNLPLHVSDLPLIFPPCQEAPVLDIDIEDPDLCWLYAGRSILDIRPGASPLHVRLRLHAVGVRPISNVVDATNYILLEVGQPLHAFDLDRLSGGKILVRPAAAGEILTTLDGRERCLSPGDLCICDAGGPIALAGIMGGESTEITDKSRNVFLESAVFRPRTIRRTSRRMSLSTEASYRFERGIDQRRAIWALDRACALVAAFAGGKTQKELSLAEPRPFRPAYIDFRPQRANSILGLDLSRDFAMESFHAIGCGVENCGSGEWRVQQPSWRPDLTREADLVEELGRIHGLDAIPPKLPAIRKNLSEASNIVSPFDFCQRIRRWGAGIGLNEAINYSFVSTADLDRLSVPEDGRIRIFNPLSEEQNVLRTCLMPGLLNALRNNLAQGAQSLHIFETANVFQGAPENETGVRENQRLGILLYGLRNDLVWPHREELVGYADIKGIVENCLRELNLGNAEYSLEKSHSYLAPCVPVLMGKEKLGHIGCVKQEIAAVFHAQRPVWTAELDLAILRELHLAGRRAFLNLPIYPPVRRDITVITPHEIKTAAIVDRMRSVSRDFLEDVQLIDLFEPASANERNLTFRLTFRHPGRTLKDAEVDRERERIVADLQKNMPVRI